MKKRYPFLPKNWLLVSIFTFFATSLSINLQAQTGPTKQWDKSFGGSDDDELYSLQQTSDGGYIMGGWSDSGISVDKTQASKGLVDYWVVKLDAGGTKLWDKSIGGSGIDLLSSLRQTSDGGYILGGTSGSYISGDKSQNPIGSSSDFWVVKLNASGNKIWDKTFGGDNGDYLTSMQQTLDGGYILGGRSWSGISGDKTQANYGVSIDYWVVKLDANGNKTWDKTFGGMDDDKLTSLQQTSDGGYILGGESASDISGDKSQANRGTGSNVSTDYWVLKLDANGTKLWDKTFGGSQYDFLFSLQQTLDGGYILGGESWSGVSGDKSQVSKGYADFWIVKLDASGNKTWDKTYGGNNMDRLASLHQTSDGGYILGGASDSDFSSNKSQPCQGLSDYWIIKTDAAGNKIWDKTFGGSDIDKLTSLKQTTDGGFILGGLSDSGLSSDKSQGSKGLSDFWVIKLAGGATGIKETENSFAVTISPNPSQGKFKLQLSNITRTKAELIVSDLLGRMVLQQELQVTNNQISQELDLPNAKGIYLLQLKAGEQTIRRKIAVE